MLFYTARFDSMKSNIIEEYIKYDGCKTIQELSDKDYFYIDEDGGWALKENAPIQITEILDVNRKEIFKEKEKYLKQQIKL